MPAVAALALTLALAPAPSPATSGGPVGDLLGGVGQIVDDLLTGDATATPGASPTPRPSGSAAPAPVPAVPSAPANPSAAPGAPGASRTLTPGRTAEGPGRERAPVPAPNGATSNSDSGSTDAAPPLRDDGGVQPWLTYSLAAGVLAVPVVLLLRRRRQVADATPGQAGPSAPAPDPEPVVDNVTRLPTDLNAIYELGRLDERLRQEREHRR